MSLCCSHTSKFSSQQCGFTSIVRRMSAEPADTTPPRLRCRVLLRANPGPGPPRGLGFDGVVDPLRGIRAGEAMPVSEVVPTSMMPKKEALASQQSDDGAGQAGSHVAG